MSGRKSLKFPNCVFPICCPGLYNIQSLHNDKNSTIRVIRSSGLAYLYTFHTTSQFLCYERDSNAVFNNNIFKTIAAAAYLISSLLWVGGMVMKQMSIWYDLILSQYSVFGCIHCRFSNLGYFVFDVDKIVYVQKELGLAI